MNINLKRLIVLQGMVALVFLFSMCSERGKEQGNDTTVVIKIDPSQTGPVINRYQMSDGRVAVMQTNTTGEME